MQALKITSAANRGGVAYSSSSIYGSGGGSNPSRSAWRFRSFILLDQIFIQKIFNHNKIIQFIQIQEKDQDLFYIARESLLTDLPPGWGLYQRRDWSSEPFYYTIQTNQYGIIL